MTEEEYIEVCKKKVEEDARDVLENYLKPFSMLRDHFYPNNMSRKKFESILQEMERPADECQATKT